MIVRFEKIIIFLLFFLLPSQLAIHFWPVWSTYSGLRIDYLSPTLYLTDLFILSLFPFWLIQVPNFKPSRNSIKSSLVIIILIGLNVYFAISPLLAIFKWIRLLEYLFFSLYLIRYWQSHLDQLITPFSLGLIWTSLLTWLQTFSQSSVGGIWFWLGERSISVTSPLIAKISLGNLGLFLRPYATLPHPNALAGFLLLSSLLLIYLRQKHPSKNNLLCRFSILFSLTTIPLTFSRSSLLLGLLFLFLYFFPRRLFTKLIFILPLFILGGLIINGNPSSIFERLSLISKSLTIIANYPLFGIGLNNFIIFRYIFPPSVSSIAFQPVHNLFLLLVSELGLLFCITFIVISRRFLKFTIYASHWLLSLSVIIVLLSGLIDHYWLTSTQNIFLLSVLFAFIKLEFDHDQNINHKL